MKEGVRKEVGKGFSLGMAVVTETNPLRMDIHNWEKLGSVYRNALSLLYSSLHILPKQTSLNHHFRSH